MHLSTNPLARPEPNSAFIPPPQDAQALAQHNALRRLVRCLFAEGILDSGSLVFAPQGNTAWLPLWEQHALVYFSALRAAPARTFLLDGTITLVEPSGKKTAIDTPGQLIDLLAPCFDFTATAQGLAGLKNDMANSVANDALARGHRRHWNEELRRAILDTGSKGLVDYVRHHRTARDAAVLLEQWGSLEGHPFYPTWKTKPQLSPAEVAQLSPEFNACVPVRIAALRADMAYVERMPHVRDYRTWFSQQFPDVWQRWSDSLRARQQNADDWLPLPIHTWHLEHYVKEAYADEIAEGVLITDGIDIDTRPTMSFRTMVPQLPGATPFIKLPLALWLTSEQRSLQAKSIHMGPRISTVIERILAEENGFDRRLEIFPEEVALHYRHAVRQEDRPGRHLSVAYRGARQALDRSDGLLPITVATLFTASPLDARPLVTELIERAAGRATPETVGAYFRQYARAVTRPVVAIYLLYGIGLEAHQQNTSVLCSEDGSPRGLLIRDFGDGRTFAPLLEARGYTLQPYVHPGILPTVFRDDIEPVRTFVLDACFVCHLHELALALTHEYQLHTTWLWEILREETEGAFDVVQARVEPQLWRAEREQFLHAAWPTRSVLRMHLQQYADYRLQHRLPNPLGAAPTCGKV
ncbi:MAG: IucA/IucC family protein [Pseudomonadota bacterium]